MKKENSLKNYVLLHKADISKILLAIIFIMLIFVPLITMLSNLTVDGIKKVFSNESFFTTLSHSLIASIISTIITVVLAYLAAYFIERSNIKAKGIFSIIFLLPMLTPSLSIGMGIIIVAGQNGIIANLLNVNVNVYGLVGIIIGSFLYSFPVAFLMFQNVLKYENATPYEAAEVLGINKFKQFTSITLPYLKKPLISIVFAIFTLIITDYGVPLMVGGKYTTLPVVMYQDVIERSNYNVGVVYGCIFLIPAILAFLVDILNKENANSSFVTKPFENNDNKLKKVVAYAFSAIISAVIAFFIFSFIIMGFAKSYPNNLTFTLDNIAKTFKLRAGRYLLNSVIIALLVSVLGVVIAFFTAYMTARMKTKTSKFLHLSSITSAAVPGLVLGLSYLLVFRKSILNGTILILVLVNMVHFISSPYLMMYNTFSKLNENLEAVGHTLGISRVHMIKDVFVPTCKGTLMEMFSYFFVNCMMTISAVSFLYYPTNKPISLMINQFEAQMQYECAAIVSLMILGINLIVKGTIHIIKTKRKKQTV